MQKLGIIGCGNMGGAIAQSLPDGAVVYDSDQQKMEVLTRFPGIEAASSLEDLLDRSQRVLLAVKPQILPSLYPILRKHNSSEKAWISIAAGVPLAVLAEELGSDQVVRFMPNIAASQKAAVTAYAAHPNCWAENLAYARDIAHSFGQAFHLNESQFSAFIGISGSAIAFILQFCHALSMGGVREGIPYPQALEIVSATMNSTNALLSTSKQHPVALATMVCSAGGTTIEGMQALCEGAFDAVVMQAVKSSCSKSKAMEERALLGREITGKR